MYLWANDYLIPGDMHNSGTSCSPFLPCCDINYSSIYRHIGKVQEFLLEALMHIIFLVFPLMYDSYPDVTGEDVAIHYGLGRRGHSQGV